jgi:DNA/RNA endonuclease YhcR with UshA esterase domain
MLLCLNATLALGFLILEPALSQKNLTAAEAKDHLGETTTVCGSVVSTRYASSMKGQPTFLNLDKPYPNQVFTVVIWGTNLSKFGTPETGYKGKRVCVTGKITEYRGAPEIIADDPKQIRIDAERILAHSVAYSLPNVPGSPRRPPAVERRPSTPDLATPSPLLAFLAGR